MNGITARCCRVLLSCCLLLTAGGRALHAAEVGTTDERQRVIVLRNGHVIHGQVTYLGDHCSILLASGGQVRLACKEIAADAASKADAYRALRDSMAAPNAARPHLELARWCIRERLYAEATEELLLVMRLDPQNPQIDALSRQLTALSAAGSAPAADVSPESNTPQQATAAASNDEAAASIDELEQTMRSLPKGAMEQFTRSMQPMLLNRCGTNRCHDTGSSAQFRLLRPSVGNQFWRRLNLRNLQATVAYIDNSDPDASRLLKMAITPHGGRLDPPLGEKEMDQYEALAAWVRLAAGGSSVQATADATTADGDESAVAEQRVALLREEVPPLESPPPTSTNAATTTTHPDSGDPFDPEEFNRRFLPERR